MERVTENGISRLENHLFGAFVTTCAIGSDGEGEFALVAGPAGMTFFHLLHRKSFAFFSGNEKAGVTILALELDVQMDIVRKHRAGAEIDVFYGVATSTVRLYGKRYGAVMAPSARFPLLHLDHGLVRVVGCGTKKAVVAVAARKFLFKMEIMAEDDHPEVGYVYGNFFRDVAAGALFERERTLAMTRAARQPFLHVSHRGGRIIRCSDFKKGIMTRGAIVV